MKLLPLIQGGAVGFLGLFTGAMGLIAVSLLPYWSSLAPAAYRLQFQALGPHLGAVMVPLMLLSIGFSAVATYFSREARLCWAVAVLSVLAVVPLYGIVHAPVNSMLLGNEPLTDEFANALRSKWFLWHWVRTALGGVALMAALNGLIARGPGGK